MCKQHHDYFRNTTRATTTQNLPSSNLKIFRCFAELRFLLIALKYRSSIYTQRLGGRFYDSSNNVPQGNDIFSDYQHDRCFNISIDFLFHF
jgi:hypothetical protein